MCLPNHFQLFIILTLSKLQFKNNMHKDMSRKTIEEEPALRLLLEGKEHFTLKYMLQFKCTGSECEVTCCQYWSIAFDESYYNKLKERMNSSNEERDKFQSSVERVKGDKGPDSYASFKLRSDATCSLLSKDNMCTIHRDYGESMLSTPCNIYPRFVSKVGMRVELSTELSCPETAKLCLLAEDATELVELDIKTLPPGYYYVTVPLPNNDPFLNCVNVVRHTVFKLLSLQQYSISTRLFYCVTFADRALPFFYKNTTSFSEDEMLKELTYINNPKVHDKLYREFNTIGYSGNLVMSIIEPILTLYIGLKPECHFSQFSLDCLKSYQAVGDVTGDGPIELLVSHEELWNAYEKRRSYWESSAFGERIDTYFSNYCRNFLINFPYTFSSDLLSYFRRMLVHYAMLRFLFFSNPELAALQKTLQGTSVEGSIVSGSLDGIIVKTVRLFTKYVEHNGTLVKKIQQNLDDRNIKNAVQLLSLIKF